MMFCTIVVRLLICSVMFATSGSSAEPGARQVVSPNWLVAACQPMGHTQWPCGVTANGALHATHLLFLWSQRAQCWNLKKHSSCAAGSRLGHWSVASLRRSGRAGSAARGGRLLGPACGEQRSRAAASASEPAKCVTAFASGKGYPR